MLMLVAVSIQGQQVNAERILLQLFNAQLQLASHLLAGADISVQRGHGH